MTQKHFTGTGPRQPPYQPFADGPVFHDVRPGDRVVVTGSGRTGTVVRRMAQKRDGFWVAWDEPVFGVTHGRVAWSNLAPFDG